MTGEPMMARFLAPAHALSGPVGDDWQAAGVADSPGEDARCRLFIQAAPGVGLQARFAAFGPPVVIACLDWVCEAIDGRTPAAARGLTLADVEQALALTPTQRYAGVMSIDALTNALVQLES